MNAPARSGRSSTARRRRSRQSGCRAHRSRGRTGHLVYSTASLAHPDTARTRGWHDRTPPPRSPRVERMVLERGTESGCRGTMRKIVLRTQPTDGTDAKVMAAHAGIRHVRVPGHPRVHPWSARADNMAHRSRRSGLVGCLLRVRCTRRERETSPRVAVRRRRQHRTKALPVPDCDQPPPLALEVVALSASRARET
jgi:hypothetical protein